MVLQCFLVQGSESLYIKAKCIILTKTYDIQDLLLYVKGDSNSHFSSLSSSGGYLTGNNVTKAVIDNLITLPSAFEISYIGNSSTNDGSWNNFIIGENNDNKDYYSGMFVSKGAFLRKQGTNTLLINQSNVYNYNEDTTVIYQYNNGVHKLKINNNEYTVTNSDYTPIYFIGLGIGSNTKIKELKIKSL